MIKNLLMSSLAAVAITGSALAADLPARMAPPPPPPVPVFTWTGAYIGINGGGIFNRGNQDGFFATPGACNPINPGCSIAVPSYGTLMANAISSLAVGNNTRGGFLGGGQIGINYQWNSSFVVGGELDGQGVWANNNNNNNVAIVTLPNTAPGFGAFPVTAAGGLRQRLEYIVTARLRAGFLATPSLLIYGTGGAAFGGVRTTAFVNTAFPTDATVTAGPTAFTDGSQTRVGWTAGGGLEWMFLPNWSLKGEALYYDLGRFNTLLPSVTSTATFVPGAVVGSALPGISHRERGIIARGGLNYHFGWTEASPVVARY